MVVLVFDWLFAEKSRCGFGLCCTTALAGARSHPKQGVGSIGTSATQPSSPRMRE